LGFNRLSLGVQDYDPQVQQAVHRVQSPQLVQSLLDAARARGFESVNFDLIYGLPKQTLVSFERTIDQVIAQRPDRIAVYAYAHLPVRFKPQRRIHTEDLPASSDKLQMLITAQHKLLQAGYDYIGMDHFALPGDELAVAQRMGHLHRNFQGYSTQPDCDLLALGVSSIGRMGATYHQNAKTLEEYYDALDHDRLPVVRGLALSRDDLVRRAIIMALMCQGQVLFEEINQAYLVDFQRAFAREWEALAELEEDGLVSTDTQGIDVTPKGRFLVRAIAMVFDRYLQADLDRSRFSKII
jgi:oxygen-independent coproporphyrinogen-3 oxidase